MRAPSRHRLAKNSHVVCAPSSVLTRPPPIDRAPRLELLRASPPAGCRPFTRTITALAGCTGRLGAVVLGALEPRAQQRGEKEGLLPRKGTSTRRRHCPSRLGGRRGREGRACRKTEARASGLDRSSRSSRCLAAAPSPLTARPRAPPTCCPAAAYSAVSPRHVGRFVGRACCHITGVAQHTEGAPRCRHAAHRETAQLGSAVRMPRGCCSNSNSS